MNKIVFITIYYGDKPNYLNLFLDSASKNYNFDFVIFSEWNEIPNYGDNIKYIKLPFEEFNRLAISKGIIRNPIIHKYKLCDLKPAWFHLLDDIEFLKRYDFIGYVDIDMILGSLDHFINDEKLNNVDLWTISNVLISGAFTIYKNSEKMKLLYRKSDCWQQVFDHPNNLAFDETLHMCDFKYLNNVKLISFTDLVYNESRNGLRVLQENNIVYELYYKTLRYKNGELRDLSGTEYISYHYVKVKKHLWWYFPKWKTLPKSFYLNKFGFSHEVLGPINLLKIFLIPHLFFNSLKKIKPYFQRLLYHILHTDFKSIIITIKDKL